jgi:SSS family transporter
MGKLSYLLIILGYFSLLIIISFITGKKADSNKAFFLGNKRSPWYVVAFGMIGTSISGVTFISVPGMVQNIGFTYMQMVLGFFVGYLLIAAVLLPLYYKLNLTSIYTYLEKRFGTYSYKTGASFFLLSKTIGAAARLYVVAIILQTFVFNEWGIPFETGVFVLIFLVWLYTFRSGVKTIVWTDALQTLFLLIALTLIIIGVYKYLQLPFKEIVSQISHNNWTRTFVFDDWISRQNFFKQFFSGVFITIVMTGLDQDMMQKNLSCKTIGEAKKNMYTYGFMFIPINLLFLSLGALLLLLAQTQQIELPDKADKLLPFFANGFLGIGVSIFFFVGIIAAAFSSVDSALTSLTTSFSVDILNVKHENPAKAKKERMLVHIAISLIFAFIIMLIHWIGNTDSIIDTIYSVASYTYGPLLGMYAFGLFTRRKVRDKAMPFVAIASPLLCFGLNQTAMTFFNYTFGYELLIINGMITFAAMWVLSKNNEYA